MFEIDKFESIKEQLIDKIDEEQIRIFRTYLQAKKEVIQEFHTLFFTFPTLTDKDYQNLINRFFYNYVQGASFQEKDKEPVKLNYPPEICEKVKKHYPEVFYYIKQDVEYLLDIINDTFIHKRILAVTNCYKALDANFKKIGPIPFKDLGIPEILKKVFYGEPTFLELGFYSFLTPYMLQFKIFFEKLQIPFDSEADIDFYELAFDFINYIELLSYDISNNTYSIKPPCPKLFAIDLNSEEEVLKKSDYIKDLSIYFDLD